MIALATKSPEETQELGAAVADALQPGDVVLLIGDMGAGKTTFVKGLGAALGVTEPITSPTFVLLHTYQGRMPLHHADLYRLDQLDEVVDLGIAELLEEGGIALVEWADRGVRAFPRDVLTIAFEYDEDDENVRRFVLSASGDLWTSRMPWLEPAVEKWRIVS